MQTSCVAPGVAMVVILVWILLHLTKIFYVLPCVGTNDVYGYGLVRGGGYMVPCCVNHFVIYLSCSTSWYMSPWARETAG